MTKWKICAIIKAKQQMVGRNKIKKRILKLILMTVLTVFFVVPMIGSGREMTFGEYREMRFEQLQSHVNSKNEADFTVENWTKLQEHVEYWLGKIAGAVDLLEVWEFANMA